MLALEVGRGNFADLGVERRIQRLDQARFPDAGLAGEEVDPAPAAFTQGLDTLAAAHRGLEDGVTGAFVDAPEGGDLLREFFLVKVHFGQDD